MQYGRDWLIETMPEVIELVAKGKAQGRTETEIQVLQQVVLAAVQARFPSLMALAQQQVAAITEPVTLRKLHVSVIQASDKAAVQQLLTTSGV